jgi:hypothetical protein
MVPLGVLEIDFETESGNLYVANRGNSNTVSRFLQPQLLDKFGKALHIVQRLDALQRECLALERELADWVAARRGVTGHIAGQDPSAIAHLRLAKLPEHRRGHSRRACKESCVRNAGWV